MKIAFYFQLGPFHFPFSFWVRLTGTVSEFLLAFDLRWAFLIWRLVG